MCLAVPVKIVEIHTDQGTGVGEIGGVRKEIQLGFVEDLKKGDYVLLHAGFAIQRINKEEAEESIAAWKELNSEIY